MSRHRNPAAPASPTTYPPAPRRSAATFAKGLGSLLLVLLFVAGVPWLLIRIGAYPTSTPDPGALWRTLTGPDLSGRAVFTVLAALVWLGWAWFTLSILKETTAAISSSVRQPHQDSRPTSRRASWSMQPAAVLVAAIVAMFVAAPLLAAGAPPAAAAGHPSIDTSRPGTVATAAHNPSQATPGIRSATRVGDTKYAPQTRAASSAAPITASASNSTKTTKSTAATTTYTVRRYDTLWSIAQHQLGDPTRYREIVTLNPHLKRDTTIHTGDVLTLPQHSNPAAKPAPPRRVPTGSAKAASAAPADPAAAAHVTVELGDTLSEIAAEHGVRDWHTVWDANKGKAEPGGKHFTNPDHIEVGWDITIPAAASKAAPPATPAPAVPAAPAAPTAPGAGTSSADAPDAQGSTTPPAGTVASAPAGADHRHGPAGENREQDPASPVDAGQVPVAPSTVPPSAQAQASTPAGQPGQASPVLSGEETQEHDLATVAGYVAGGTVLAAGILGALVLVRRQQFRDRRPGRTIASTPEPLIPLERAIVSAAAPSADEMARVDQVLRRIAATDVPVLHVAAVQLHAGEITVHLSEPALLPAPWRPATDEGAGADTLGGSSDTAGEAVAEGVAWTFPAGLVAEEAGADPSIVEAIAPFPTLVHIGSDATSAWLLNLEQTGTLVLTGDRDRCLSLARVMSAQLGVNAWADIVAVTMLGFGHELIETAPSRLRYAPADAAGQVLAAATASANQTADFAGGLGLAVVEARRRAAGDEAWPVHVLLATTAAAGDQNETAGGEHDPAGPAAGNGATSRLAELLEVVHQRSGATGAAVVVVDEQRLADNPGTFSGATVAHLDAGGTMTMPQVGLTVQAIGWDEDTSRGVGMLMAHLRNAPDQPVPEATGEQPWQHLADAAGALRAELVQARATPAVHDSQRPVGATTLPLSDEVYVEVAATTTEDLQVLAPTVSAELVERVMAADPSLDEDLAAWFDPDSHRAKLAVLGPLTLSTRQPPPKRPAYYAELAAYLAFRDHGATAEEFMAAFSLSQATSRTYLSNLRELLGTDPVTGRDYMPSAKTNPAAKARGVGVYLIKGMLLDADLFRRLRVRGQARGPAGMEDYATALRLVTGPPFSQLRDDGGTWLLEGDRIDHYLSLAVVDVAHLLATSALAAGDTATARAAVDIARLAAPDEESPRLDAAAVDVADGRTVEARQTLREQVCNRSDDGEPPMDLNPRTRQILARHRDWLSRAS